MKNKLKLVGTLLLTVLVLVIVLQNTETVDTKLLFATVSMPRAVLLLLTALTGFAAGLLTAWIWLYPRQRGSSVD